MTMDSKATIEGHSSDDTLRGKQSNLTVRTPELYTVLCWEVQVIFNDVIRGFLRYRSRTPPMNARGDPEDYALAQTGAGDLQMPRMHGSL